MWSGRAWLVALTSIGCRAHSSPSLSDEARADLTCDRLPATRPASAVLHVSRVDGESLTLTLDAALVADAACPTSFIPPAPACVRLAEDAMDYVWRELVAVTPHTIAIERHDECIHCGGPWILLRWNGGTCERGTGHFHDVAKASQPRFDRAMQVLEAAAAAGGVEARSSLP